MKQLVLIFVCLLGLTFGLKEDRLVAQKLQNYKFDIPEKFVEEFLRIIENDQHGVKASTAIVNDYTDRLLANVGQFIIQSGLDPMEMPDLHASVLTGQLNLTNGWIQGTSTISRYGDCVVTYDRTKKYYTLDTTLLFDAIQFTYDWRAKVLLIPYDGSVVGKVRDLRVQVILGFNFDTYQASLDKFDITKTGRLTLKFSGNALVDWLVNAMSSVVSALLHPIIIRIIQSIVKLPLEAVVSVVNEIINSILHPTVVAALL